MNIEAGRAITRAMEDQRFRDLLRMVVWDFIATGKRMEKKLRAAGWDDLADFQAESVRRVEEA